MPERNDEPPRGARGFWSGTISFGLVSVPVSLFTATRTSGPSLRMIDPDGTPLRRVYFCSSEQVPLEADDIVRGYEIEKERFVLIEDEELEAIAPEKSQEIALERFVDVDAIDPIYFERAYFLAPGRGGARPYRLLAEVMERCGRAGIATFVMRGKEYLVAIISERGLLRAETLRFHDELRRPKDVGLPALEEPDDGRVKKMKRALEKLEADTLDREALRDSRAARLEALVERKLASGSGVISAPEDAEPSERESAEIIDLMQVLKQSLAERGSRGEKRSNGEKPPSAEKPRSAEKKRPKKAAKAPRAARRSDARREDDLAAAPKSELYERAKRLDIPGRSGMSKEQLIDAIRSAS
ncbi:MAG TPA: Ku protein [Pseudomonadales bacterium]